MWYIFFDIDYKVYVNVRNINLEWEKMILLLELEDNEEMSIVLCIIVL